MISDLFGFGGRIARLAYFGRCLLVFICIVVAVGGGFILIAAGSSVAIGWAVGVILIFGGWANIALTVKRLHDIGLAGTHAIWVFILNGTSGAVAVASPALSIVLGFVALGVSLWLLFQPGSSRENRYGLPPGIRPKRAPMSISV